MTVSLYLTRSVKSFGSILSGLSLSAIAILFVYEPVVDVRMQIAVLTFCLLCAWQVYRWRAARMPVMRALYVLTFALTFTLSIAINLSEYAAGELFEAAARLANVASVLLIGALFAGSTRLRQNLGYIMTSTAIVLGGFSVFLVLTTAVGVEGRLAVFGIHPNWWGEVAACVGFASLFFRQLLFRLLGLCASIYLMFVFESRGAMLALVLPVLGWSLWSLVVEKASRSRYLPLAVAIVALIVFTFFIFPLQTYDFLNSSFSFVSDRVLLLSDPYRGLGTGFVSRTPTWALAFELWLSDPFFGIGFGRSDEISLAREGLAVHNGFLILLAENGLLGVVLFVVGVAWAVAYAVKIRDWPAVCLLVGYCIMMMFAPRAVNLNVLSLSFFFVLGSCLGRLDVKPTLAVKKSEGIKIPSGKGTAFGPVKSVHHNYQRTARRAGCAATAQDHSDGSCNRPGSQALCKSLSSTRNAHV